MDSTSDLEERIAAVAALDQPLRRELYRLLVDAPGWTSRDVAAAALGVPRSVAAFHLDRLADAGVVEVRFERTSGRTGPGAGRPSKLYRPSHDEVAASVPDRHYDLAGSLLATAVADSTRTGRPVTDCLRAVARSAGRDWGEDTLAVVEEGAPSDERRAAVIDALERQGYEPEDDADSGIRLGNCPFHRLAEAHRELVCGMNLDYLEGFLDGLGPGGGLTASLEPEPGYCCVRISTH